MTFKAWVKKTKKVRKKYTKERKVIFKELHRLRPRTLGKYYAKRSFITLSFLYTLTRHERMLYQQFIRGAQVYMTAPTVREEEKLKFACQEIIEQGEELLQNLKQQEHLLEHFEDLFETIKLDVEHAEKGLFFHHINDEKLDELFISLPAEESIRRVHSAALQLLSKWEKVRLHIQYSINNANAQLILLQHQASRSKAVGAALATAPTIFLLIELLSTFHGTPVDTEHFSSLTKAAKAGLWRT